MGRNEKHPEKERHLRKELKALRMREFWSIKCTFRYGIIVAMKQAQPNVEKVALYARVSTKDGRQDTENQLIQLREYCRKQGWTITAEYTDHETGGTSKRPHFQRMFEDASRRKFDVLVVWALDRLSREGVWQTFNHIKVLNGYGVQFESYMEPQFRTTGACGELMLALAAWIAEQERIRRSERAKAAIARLKRQGTTDHLGRPPKVKAAKLEKARQLRADGMSLRQIAVKLHVSHMAIQRAFKEE